MLGFRGWLYVTLGGGLLLDRICAIIVYSVNHCYMMQLFI